MLYDTVALFVPLISLLLLVSGTTCQGPIPITFCTRDPKLRWKPSRFLLALTTSPVITWLLTRHVLLNSHHHLMTSTQLYIPHKHKAVIKKETDWH